MSSLNRVMLIGNIGRDPEIRSMQNGDRVCSLSLATSESWKDKNTGDRRERTEWHRVVVWNQHIITILEKHVSKGDKIYVAGQLQTRKWSDQQGVERYTTEVVLKRFGADLLLLGGSGSNQVPEPPPAGDDTAHVDDDLDDEIPF